MLNKIFAQINSAEMEPISGIDAAFIYAESPTTHMHVGSVAIIDGNLQFEDFRKIVESKIHLIPNLRKKLITVPLGIDYPYWVDDPHFDINLHMDHMALPGDGGWKELRQMASRIFSEPLDQSRPLWSFTFVEGLNNVSQVPKGSVAVISKIHHVAIDGMAGASQLSIIYDISPKVKPIPEPKPFNPAPLPNELTMMMKSAINFAKTPLKFPSIIKETVKASVKAGAVSRVQKLKLPTAPFTAPVTPLNGIISPLRKWNSTILSLSRLKRLKEIKDTTLNDVILAICAGALRRYLLEKDKLPAKPLVAMIPISTRTSEEKESGGNKVASMLVQLATHVEDPLERLDIINENTVRGKTYQNAIGAKALSSIAEAVPFGIANQAARLYTRYNMSELHKPAMNLTITNVPGPQMPLYIHGHKVLSVMGMAPIFDGMGLIITIFSYNGQVTISPTSDVNSMPDMNKFSKYILDSANEMEELILKYEKDMESQKKDEDLTVHSNALFEELRNYLKENPKAVKANSGLFEFHISKPVSTHWRIDLNKSPGVIKKVKVKNPDATFTMEDAHLMQVASGQLNIQTALIQGRLKVSGDVSKAMKLGDLISKVIKEKK